MKLENEVMRKANLGAEIVGFLQDGPEPAQAAASVAWPQDAYAAGAPMDAEAVRTILYLLYAQGHQHVARRAEAALEAGTMELCCEFNTEAAVTDQLIRNLGITDAGEMDHIRASHVVANGLAAFVCGKARQLIKTADITLAMNLEAIRGETGAFDDRLHSLARPYKGQIACAENVRRLIETSDFTTDKGRYGFGYDTHPRVQDVISVRAAPQTHGGVRDFYDYCAEQAYADFAEESEKRYRTEFGMNALSTALADLANISELRTFRLLDTRLSYGLPMNLVMDTVGINHGFPVVQSTQAAEIVEQKLYVLPATAIKRDNRSMSYYTLTKLLRELPLLSKTLSVELLMSAQGMDIVQEKLPELHPGKGTAAALRCLREKVETLRSNRFMAVDMVAAEALVFNGSILGAAEAVVGQLK